MHAKFCQKYGTGRSATYTAVTSVSDTNDVNWPDSHNGMNDYYDHVTTQDGTWVQFFSGTDYTGTSHTVQQNTTDLDLKSIFDYKVASFKVLNHHPIVIDIANDLKTELSPKELEAVALATDAFIYGLPLILMDLTKEQITNCVVPCNTGAPINQFRSRSAFINASFKGVVRPNYDTFYSVAFFNVSEPMVMCIPETGNQYYLMPLLDGFTNVISQSPGTRTGQTQGGNYILVGPRATIPSNINQSDFSIIPCPTDMVWALGRFQVNDPNLNDMGVDGGGYVATLQSKLQIIPLSEWQNKDTYKPLPGKVNPYVATSSPNDSLKAMPITAFFDRLNQLLLTNPPPEADASLLQRFAKIGVGVNPAKPFSERDFNKVTLDTMNKIPNLVVTKSLESGANKSANSSGGWHVTLNHNIGNYGKHHVFRALIAINGLGANLIEDAVYYSTAKDAVGDALDCSGGQQYTLTFPLPTNNANAAVPVNAFWSVTLYDAEGYFVKNTIGRYAVGHSSENQLVTTDNNGNYFLTIYIQAETIPSDAYNYPNWLPAPAGIFNLMLRAYWPEATVLNGSWTPPLVQKVRLQNQ